jgi:hypothetical protein
LPTSDDSSAVKRVEQLIARLQARSALNRGPANNPLENLAEATTSLADIPPPQAESLAHYLLTARRDADQERILSVAGELGRWMHLRLALADGLERTTLKREQLQALLSAVLGEPVTLGQGEAGREALRATVLASVLEELSDSTDATKATSPYDVLRTELAKLYAQQAQLLGVSGAELPALERPSQWLRPLLEQYSKRIVVADPPAKKQWLELLSPRLVATEYLATDDLQRTVLFEREWATLLALDVSLRRPDQKERAEQILQELRSQDRASRHIVHQLRHGQAALLRLWLLHSPASS